MTSPNTAPPLPQPQRPARAGQAVAQAAQAAASAWARPLEPALHDRAVRQLCSVLRDLGIAAQGLAGFEASGAPLDDTPERFAQHVTIGARWLTSAMRSLDGVLAAEGLGPVPDPEEPGTMLRQAARDAILAWRQPSGPTDERDFAVRWLITAVAFISAGALSLSAHAPRRLVLGLQAAGVSLAEAATHLDAAIHAPRDDTEPRVAQSPGTAGGGQ